jgi:hypothetical protein
VDKSFGCNKSFACKQPMLFVFMRQQHLLKSLPLYLCVCNIHCNCCHVGAAIGRPLSGLNPDNIKHNVAQLHWQIWRHYATRVADLYTGRPMAAPTGGVGAVELVVLAGRAMALSTTIITIFSFYYIIFIIVIYYLFHSFIEYLIYLTWEAVCWYTTPQNFILENKLV